MPIIPTRAARPRKPLESEPAATATHERLAGDGDGRRARGERARSAVVEALLALIQEGDLRPTAPRIAARAGVSRRLLFHHFTDLEDLFAELSLRQGQRVAELIDPIPTELPFEQRLQRFTAQRARLLEYLTPFRRAARLQEPSSPDLAQRLGGVRAAKRAQVLHVFAAEIALLPEELRATAASACATAASFSAWEDLRVHQGLEPAAAEQTLAYLLRVALGRRAG